MRKIVFVVFVVLAATAVSAQEPQPPVQHVDERPLMKISLSASGCRLDQQIATDVIGHLFPKYRIGDAAGTPNLARQKRQIKEERSEHYSRGRGRKLVGYFQSADYTLNVSVSCESRYQAVVSVGSLIGTAANAALRKAGHYYSFGHGNIVQQQQVAVVRVSMSLEANGDIVTVESGSGKAEGRSGNFGKVFTLETYSNFSNYDMAIHDGFNEAAKKAKKNMRPR